MAQSRTRQVVLNATASLATQVLMIFLNFVSRTVFIKTLDIDYLGVNGLFSNILSVLSFAELGIGNAIVFSLYRPLAEHNEERLCSLMQLYKKFYLLVFVVVITLGFALIPFLDLFIKEKPNIDENLVLIYLFFLFDTALSYLYIYKQSIITADQKQYVVTTVLTSASILRVLGQIVILYVTHNFILFLCISLLFRLAGNVYCSHVADKRYPFIRNTPKPLPKEEKKKIFTNVKSMAAYKFGSIILNSSNNIIISAMVNITTVGLVSNYTMLSLACNNILNGIVNAFTASLGNLNATAKREEKYNVFNKVLLITAWLFGLVSIEIIVVSDYFVEMWIGSEFIINKMIVIALICEFYVAGIHTLESHYRYTMGYFVKGRLAPILAAIMNVILAILFCRQWGVAGIFFATAISRVITLGIIDSFIIFRDGFKLNPIIYFVKNAGFVILFISIGLLCSWVVSFFAWHTWGAVLLQVITILVIYNIVMFLLFYRTRSFKEIIVAAKMVISKEKGEN